MCGVLLVFECLRKRGFLGLFVGVRWRRSPVVLGGGGKPAYYGIMGAFVISLLSRE